MPISQLSVNSNQSAPRFQHSKIVARTVSMTSSEIAELTGKQHKNVIRDIREMLDELQKDGSDMSHVREDLDGRGYTSNFHLDREMTELLLTGYSVPLRLKVIRRLAQLEAESNQSIALPSYAETLRLYADQIEQTAVLQIANNQQAKKIESLEHLFMAGETPSQFVKRLNGVNAQKINATLLELGWIYNAESEPDRSPKYRTTSKARSQLLLTERPRKIDGEGFDKPLIRYDLQMLEKGARKLHDLYLELRLTMKQTWDQQFFYAKFSEEAAQ